MGIHIRTTAMVKRSLCLFVIFLGQTLSSRNGGNDCSTCTLVTALVSQYSQKLNVPGSEGFKQFCDLMPTPVPAACKVFLKDLEDKFELDKITELTDSCSPDDACFAIGMCKQDKKEDGDLWPKCNLFPKIECEENIANFVIN